MKAQDVIVWVRVYGYEGNDQDIQFKPLTYNSFDEWQDKWKETMEALDMADFEYVDWDYVQSESDASMLMQDEATWDAWTYYIEEYGDLGTGFFDAAMTHFEGEMSEFDDWLQEAYQGEWDSMLDFAYDLIDSSYGNDIPEDLAERYFDYDAFGFALHANGDLNALIMDDWEDRYETEAEAEAVYNEFLDKSDKEIAEWYIYDVVGDLNSALGNQVKDYFDYKSFARDLEYDYDYVNGYVFWTNF